MTKLDTLCVSRHFGASPDAADNFEAFTDALAFGKSEGVAISVPNNEFRVTGDLTLNSEGATLKGTGGRSKLVFSDGGLIVEADGATNEAILLTDLRMERDGTAGPVVEVLGNQTDKFPVRWSWRNLHIDGSTGAGMRISGPFLGSIHGLWINDCAGSGFVVEQNSDGQLGTNIIGMFGGEIQNCDWGIEAEDTTSLGFHSFTVEGCHSGGIWLHGDNRNFGWFGGYFEDNARDFTGGTATDGNTDIRIGDASYTGGPNRIVKFDNAFLSDGGEPHSHAVYVEDGEELIDFDHCNFWAYASAPIRLAGGVSSTATGRAARCWRGSTGGSTGSQMVATATADFYTEGV